MNKLQPHESRNRLRELLAIPERQRTDEQWDEINELEIELAPGNREGAPPQQGARHHGSAPPGQPRPGGGSHGKKAMKKFHKRPSKGNAR